MKIGFTCGSFDLLHAGHIVMFEDCSQVCDYLIVGLQIDPTIDREDKNKPIQSVRERLIQLRAVTYVDEVVTYSTEEELYRLLTTLDIDIRIIGSDWWRKNYTGSELPLDVHFHRREHDWSTSSLRNRILEALNE